jgi:hypothetical protein
LPFPKNRESPSVSNYERYKCHQKDAAADSPKLCRKDALSNNISAVFSITFHECILFNYGQRNKDRGHSTNISGNHLKKKKWNY